MNKIVPDFDFTEALSLTVESRFDRCIEKARGLAEGYQKFSEHPCVPDIGCSKEEIQMLEVMADCQLPDEYKIFLTKCRYLSIDDGCEVGGLHWNEVYVTEIPWLSERHDPKRRFLVFANYWQYADGDQLMVSLDEPGQPIIAYLHEHGPLFEFFAPSFSLAVWRLIHE